VTIETCKKCHGNDMQQAAHANGYLDTRACVVCHSPIGHYGDEMQTDHAYLTQMVHLIHSAQEWDSVLGAERGWSNITFPQPINDCQLCHSDPDNLTTGSAAALDNWKAHPTKDACTSCHTTTTFDGAVPTHGGGAVVAVDACGCHTATGAATATDIVTVHAETVSAADTPEFEVDMTMSTPANGLGYYEAGETPVVTVTLDAGGVPVDGSVYTTPSTDATSAKGVAGGGLSGATLYVYGPRNFAAPVLTLNAASDHGESLLLPSTDPNNLTDSTGYKYQLQAIPDDLPAGTYIASVQMNDYGALSDTDYVTTSVGLVMFQVGTAAVTPNAAGNACIDCHGAERMHLQGAHPHNVPFDTDYCNACHDTTGLHGNVIANRVHAVHSATSNGDLGSHASYTWDTTFPQNVQNCKACHNSGDTGYLNDYMMVACFGCHAPAGDVSWDHMLQMGGVNTDQNPNFKQSTR